MNPIKTLHTHWCGLGLPLLLCTGWAVSANVLVTFQVDMSYAPFNSSSQTVAARGSFNGRAAFALTNNPNGANPNLWSGATNIPGNGTVMSYRYTIEPGATYETVAEGAQHDRLVSLPAAAGSSLTLPQVYFGDSTPNPVTVSVTFQVDLAQQINTGAFQTNSSSIYTRGRFNNWGQAGPMTNDPTILRTNQYGLVTSDVYVYTVDVTGSPGQTTDYKYFIDTASNWESPAPGTGDPADNNNRFFNLGSGATQTLPIVFFNDAPYAPVAANQVTFQVDMTAQVMLGNFDPSTGTVEVRGNFNGWGTPQILCTNNPADANTNIYRAVVTIKDGIGVQEQYKFWASVPVNSGWETMADNRTVTIIKGTAQTLPVVFFSDQDPVDFLPVDTVVTFSVDMAQAVGTDAHPFAPASDQVFINGAPNGFVTWDTSLPMLTNNPVGGSVYSIDLLLPKGSPVQQTYKYGINGNDDEAAANSNHVRFVRTTGSYTMPRDTFGAQQVEPSFGLLSASPAAGSSVPVSWLGRPGVHLQANKALSGGTWQDLLNTDGALWTQGYASTNGLVSVTNYPATGAKTFFRLIKE
jgi:hypothetical protein